MKKLFLLPTILAVAITPVFSLVSCEEEPVEDVIPTEIKVNSSLPFFIERGMSQKIEYTVLPEGAPQDVTFSVNPKGEDVVEVDDEGNLTGLSVGLTTVTVKCAGYPEILFTFPVQVNDKHWDPVSLSIDKTSLRLIKNKTKKMTATIEPRWADQTVTWTSNAPKVATINKDTGVITPIAAGTATITATCVENKELKASCVIKVENRSVWDTFVDPDNNKTIDSNRPSNWGYLISCIEDEDFPLTEEDIKTAIDESEAVAGGFGDWSNEYIAYVDVGGVIHQVHLVGMNQDTLADGSGNKALMTWEFTNTICTNEEDFSGRPLRTKWNEDGKTFDYWNSSINDVLNSYDEVTWYIEHPKSDKPIISIIHDSVLSLMEKVNNPLAGHIKSVIRTANTSPAKTTKNWTKTASKTKLFIPTVSNYYSYYDVMYVNQLLSNEGCYTSPSQYSYYAKHIPLFAILDLDETFYKYDLNENVVDYYLSSPSTRLAEMAYILDDGLCQEHSADELLPLAPCFCV